MGNLQSAVRAVPRRQMAAKLCQEGRSHEEIAAALGCDARTVYKYLTRYLETDSRFPVGIDASKAELMRAEQRLDIEKFQRGLLAEFDGWSKKKTSPYGMEERAIVTDKLCKLSDSFIKTSERLSAMYGLDAPKSVATPASVTNNTQINISPIASMVEEIKARRAAELEPAKDADTGH
jgi:Homeodomain-like domain